MNDTVTASLWAMAIAVGTQIVASFLKRGETRTAQEIERDKVEYEQNAQMRAELRAVVKEQELRIANCEVKIVELERKNIELERENARKDLRIEQQTNEIQWLREELDKFNRKLYYIPKKEEPKNDR
jgi:septal ring factor EnvC (AmiA/AmiB activator)